MPAAQAKPYVVVIGGANMDIAGRATSGLMMRDSNIGSVRLSPGGVGRNIAHNLALLGCDVRLVTAFGGDSQGSSLKESCRSAGIDISASITIEGGSSSTYLFVMDDTGDMLVAINDMGILEELTRERIAERMDLVRGAAVCVVDSNLPERTIAWLTAEAQVPLFCDPISVAKAPKLIGSLSNLHTIKPNLMEAEALSGIHVHDDVSRRLAGKALLDAGVGRVFVSLGTEGLMCLEGNQHLELPCLPSRLVNATGAGDAMMAALVWSYLHDMNLEEAGVAGLAASAIAVEGADTINPLMSETVLLERMRAAAPSLW